MLQITKGLHARAFLKLINIKKSDIFTREEKDGPSWFYLFDNDVIHALPFTPKSRESKARQLHMLAAMMKMKGIERYGSVVESYMVQLHETSDILNDPDKMREARSKLPDNLEDSPLSKECVLSSLVGPRGVEFSDCCIVDRQAKKFDPLPASDNISGTFTELLNMIKTTKPRSELPVDMMWNMCCSVLGGAFSMRIVDNSGDFVIYMPFKDYKEIQENFMTDVASGKYGEVNLDEIMRKAQAAGMFS